MRIGEPEKLKCILRADLGKNNLTLRERNKEEARQEQELQYAQLQKAKKHVL